MVDGETEWFLQEWGKWTKQGGPAPKGAKSWLGAMHERLIQQNREPGCAFPDDFMEAFDSTVMRSVKNQWPEDFQVLRLYYAEQMNSRDMAKRLGRAKTDALSLLKVAIGRVDTLVKAGVAA